MGSENLRNCRAAELISSITSKKIREIILNSASSLDDGWEGVSNALCGLVENPKIKTNVTLKVFVGYGPSMYQRICRSFRPKLPKNCRVLLMKKPVEVKGEAVVLHDSLILGSYPSTIGSTE